APREQVYAALLDPDAVARWRVPDGMRSEIHLFEPHEGGAFRISLTYEAQDAVGKTSGRTDTYHGRFLALHPSERIVEVIEFETGEDDLHGEMTITTTLTAAGDDTELTILHEGIPPGVSSRDNETGTQMALAKLAGLLEQR
ncbi:MAG TPA: SRPBCC domain-containing protein, partial [Solirubrobacteraceae bacterium]